MKRILAVLLCVMALSSCGVQKCEIDGELKNHLGESWIYLHDVWNDNAIIDSAKVVKGKFAFRSIKSAPTMASLVPMGDDPICFLFIEPGKVGVSGDAVERVAVAVGTVSNDAMAALVEYVKGVGKSYGDAMQSGNKEEAERLLSEYENSMVENFEANKTNVFGLYVLQQLMTSENVNVLVQRMEGVSEDIKVLPYYVKIKEYVDKKRKTEPYVEGSDYIPYYTDIVLPNSEGENISLKSVIEKKSNRYVLIDFWASWCGPCMHEIPFLVEAYKKYHGKGFEIYGISLDRTKSAWVKAIKDKKMKWVNVSPVESNNSSAVEDYAIQTIPTNFLIDCATGIIVAKDLRGEGIEEKLAELFK